MSPLPDVGDFIYIFVLYLALFVLPNMLFADGSTGWHLVTGEYILTNLSVPSTDIISYSFDHKPWVAYEWLFDVVLALMNYAGGTNLIAVALSSIIGFIFLDIYDRARSAGSGILMASFFTMVAVLVSATHWLARPHIVEYLCLLTFVYVLQSFYRGKIAARSLFMILSPVMLIWVNSHPSFALGCFIALLYFAVTLAQSYLSSSEGTRARAASQWKVLIALMAALTLLSLVNPYGYKLHLYILHYLEGQEILKATNEFMSPVFHGGLHATCLEILLIGFVAGLSRKRKVSTPMLILTIVLLHGSLAAVRNMPIFAMVVTPIIAYLWGSDKRDSDTIALPASSSAISRIVRILRDFEEQEGRSKMHLVPMIATIVLVLLCFNGGTLFGTRVIHSGFSSDDLPSTTLDYIRENNLLRKRGFNLDNWGGYLAYKLDTRVFIDDRADFYGEKFYRDYTKVMFTGKGWEETLEKYKIDWILFPKGSKLSQVLKENPNWQEVKSDRAASLFLRKY